MESVIIDFRDMRGREKEREASRERILADVTARQQLRNRSSPSKEFILTTDQLTIKEPLDRVHCGDARSIDTKVDSVPL